MKVNTPVVLPVLLHLKPSMSHQQDPQTKSLPKIIADVFLLITNNLLTNNRQVQELLRWGERPGRGRSERERKEKERVRREVS